MNIFPIYLTEEHVKNLIKTHYAHEFEASIQFLHDAQFSKFSYHGYLNEEGTVNLYVRYNSDNGFILSAGTCFRKTEKILSQETINCLVKQQMYDLAEAEYERRRAEVRERKIAKIMTEMF